MIDVASRGEAREHEARGNPYHKRHGFTASFCFLALYLWFCFVPLNHSSFRDDKSFRQRLPRRAQKLRPPRNDKSGGFCGKSEQFPERNDWKRNDFRNERLKDDAERYRAKNDRIKQKTSVFQTKTPQFRVIARPQRGRGNL